MKLIETDKWCTSSNGEMFGSACYSSREEAIEACKGEDGDSYVGRATFLEFTEIDVNSHEEDILEDLYEELSDIIGDAAENWEFTEGEEIELGKRIAKTVIDFLNETGNQPTCFLVQDIEEVQDGKND